MEDTLIYNYSRASSLVRKDAMEELFLAKYSEIHKNTDAPCFFWGNVGQPFILARCLITLSLQEILLPPSLQGPIFSDNWNMFLLPLLLQGFSGIFFPDF